MSQFFRMAQLHREVFRSLLRPRAQGKPLLKPQGRPLLKAKVRILKILKLAKYPPHPRFRLQNDDK